MWLAAVADAPRGLLDSVSQFGMESKELEWKRDGVKGKRRGNGELTFLSVNVTEVTTGIDDISYSALEFFCFWMQTLVYSLSIRRFRWVGTVGPSLGLALTGRAMLGETRRAHTWETAFRFPIPQQVLFHRCFIHLSRTRLLIVKMNLENTPGCWLQRDFSQIRTKSLQQLLSKLYTTISELLI